MDVVCLKGGRPPANLGLDPRANGDPTAFEQHPFFADAAEKLAETPLALADALDRHRAAQARSGALSARRRRELSRQDFGWSSRGRF